MSFNDKFDTVLSWTHKLFFSFEESDLRFCKNVIDVISYSFIIFGVLVVWIELGLKITAPYGRYTRAGWGFNVPGRFSWILQESPVLIVSVLCLLNQNKIPMNDIFALFKNPNVILLGLLCIHYINRIKNPKSTPFMTLIMAFIFCTLNGYIQAKYFMHFGNYDDDWIYDFRFIFGVIIFFTGMYINISSDNILMNLRKSGDKTRYKIPYGGMFRFVSGANFFGEIVEWLGFAIASYSLPALSFFIFTSCNIGPRAFHHHDWYLEKFKDEYPKDRKRLIPFIF